MSETENSSNIPRPQHVTNLPELALFAPTKTIFQRFRSAIAASPGAQPLRQLSSLADGLPICGNGRLSLVGPVIGSPAMVLAGEFLSAAGVKRAVLLSLAGAVRPSITKLRICDVVFPRAAQSEEGTSRLYQGNVYEVYPPTSLQLEVEESVKNDLLYATSPIAVQSGTIWSTDAPFRETRQKVDRYSERGVLAVEMEYAALARFCVITGIELAAVFVISDLLDETWVSGMRKTKRSESLRLTAQGIIKAVLK